MHHSYNSVGNIGEQGGRSMVGFLVGCNDAHADVNDIDDDSNDNDVSPPQLLQLNENDRLHLRTGNYFSGDATYITFCVHLLSVD